METTYQKTAVVQDVRKELDEIGVNTAGFAAGTDNQDLDTIILHQLGRAIRFCYENADLSLIEANTVKTTGDMTYLGPDDAGLKNVPQGADIFVASVNVSAPASFLRLRYAWASSWSHNVSEPLMWNSSEAAQLKNWYSTGTPDRPVVLLQPKQDGSYDVQMWTVGDGEDVEIALIIPPSSSESSGTTITVDAKIYDAIVMYCAALTLLTLKDEHADALFNLALTMIGATKQQKE